MQHIAVLGAGTMGHGIAQVCAMAGLDVKLADASLDLARRGIDRIRGNLEDGVRRGKLSSDDVDRHLAHVTPADSLEAACADADIVIEAVPEKLELKRDVLTRAEAAATDTALLASNTSSLSIGDMQAWLRRPASFLGLHFFNPVHINKLIEVVRGPATAESAMERALDLVRRIGKEAVVVNDSPGFA